MINNDSHQLQIIPTQVHTFMKNIKGGNDICQNQLLQIVLKD